MNLTLKQYRITKSFISLDNIEILYVSFVKILVQRKTKYMCLVSVFVSW
jgi:hypothetical protein